MCVLRSSGIIALVLNLGGQRRKEGEEELYAVLLKARWAPLTTRAHSVRSLFSSYVAVDEYGGC